MAGTGAGPAGLLGQPLEISFDASRVGPCWINAGQVTPFQELTPLLRSGWVTAAPSVERTLVPNCETLGSVRRARGCSAVAASAEAAFLPGS